jgi:molybdenum cofactor cytidylyltransferase
MPTPGLEAVVLAAGRSSRAGAFKPALDCGGLPLIARVTRAFQPLCSTVWVVTGYRAAEVERLVAGERRVVTVFNACWEEGMFASVKAGLSRSTAARVFVSPGDLPLISRSAVARLAEAAGRLVVPVWGGRSGHPILLSRALVEEVLRVPGASNLRDALAGIGRTEVPVDDDGILRDVDTYPDYTAISGRRGQRG